MPADRNISTTSISPAEAASGRQPARDYLVFRSGQQEYGIALDHILELRTYDAVRLTPDGAAIAAGVDPTGVIAGSMRLGTVDVAVADLGVLLHRAGAAARNPADVMIMRCGPRLAALAVDCVIDVITPAPGQVQGDTACIGMREIILLDADRLISDLHPSSILLAA